MSLIDLAREIVADVFEAKADALAKMPLPNRSASGLVRRQAYEFRAGLRDDAEQMTIALAALRSRAALVEEE